MKSPLPIAAALATLVLHAALVAAISFGLTNQQHTAPETLPVTVRLIPPAPDENAVAAQVPPPPSSPAVPPPSPAPPRAEKRIKQEKRIAKPESEVPTRVAPSPATQEVQVPPDAQPSATNPVPAPAPAPEAAPPAPSAPVTQSVRTGVSIPASYAASNPKPAYPSISRRAEEQGTVVLSVLVREDGSAGEVNIKRSSGYPALDESARKTIKSWRFKPATVDGKPIAEWYELPVPFKLVD